MAPRTEPTARQRRIAAELRRMREAAGLNVGEAARGLGVERTSISNIEAGRLGVSGERVRSLARVYRCRDEPYVDALAAMAEERVRGWWEEYRGSLGVGALDLAELEHHAQGLRSLQVTHLPGLLQTEEYAKAVMSTDVPEPAPAVLRRALSFRMRRRDVLDAASSARFTFVIHEAAMRLDFGGPAVMRAQLRHILESSERENVVVRALPFSAGGFPHAAASMNLVSGPVSRLDTVQFDVPTGTALVDDPAQLDKYRSTLDRIDALTLGEDESRRFLFDIAQSL